MTKRLQKIAWRQFLISNFIFIFGAGVIFRIVLLLLSRGSNDIFTWELYAEKINNYGLSYVYGHIKLFNHPPLMGYFSLMLYKIAIFSNLPFALIFKLPMVLIDICTALLIMRILNKRKDNNHKIAALGYIFSLIAILVSSYHGNTDSLLAFFLLWAAYLLDDKKYFSGGLVFAAALNVKLIPLILVFLIPFYIKNGRDILKFCSGLFMGLIPFIPILFCCGKSFYGNAILYNSNIENWGIDLFLLEGMKNPAKGEIFYKLLVFYISYGRFILFAAILFLTYLFHKYNKWNIFELLFLGISLFYILTPGFGIQYLVYLAPIIFVINNRWATLYSVLAGLFAAVIYYSFLSDGIPLTSIFNTLYPPPAPLIGWILWVFLIYMTFKLFTKRKGYAQEKK